MKKDPLPSLIIWLTADHLRYDNIAAHGNAEIHTPNLDKLVEHGVSFTNCFAQNPLCMPSRASFMTGLYPHQTGLDRNGPQLPADFSPTLVSAFKAAGYRTAQIGKLHFQPHVQTGADFASRCDYGFDHFALSEEPGCYDDEYTRWLREEHPEHLETFRVPLPTTPERAAAIHGKVLDAPWEYSHSGWVADAAGRYLEQRLKPDAPPQLLHLGFYAPHPPLNPTHEMFAPYEGRDISPPFLENAEEEEMPEPLRGWHQRFSDWHDKDFIAYRRHFYAMVTGLDLALGKLIAALEGHGVLDDTLIALNSDHGDHCGDRRMLSKDPSFADQLLRVPCVLHWPKGLGSKGRRVSGLCELVDLLPTLLGLGGCRVPEAMVGRDLSGKLRSGGRIAARPSVLAYHHPDWAMLRTRTHKYLDYGKHGEVLFDLSADPWETKNVIRRNKPLAAKLRRELAARLPEKGRLSLAREYPF